MGGIVAGEGRDRGGLSPRPPFLAPRQEEKYSILLLPCLVKRPPIYKGRRKRARARRTGSSASVRPPASSEVVHVSRLSPAGRALPPFSSTSIVIANWGNSGEGAQENIPGVRNPGNFDGEEGCYIISCMLWSVCPWCDAAPTSLDCSPPRSLLISLRASRIHPVTRVATSSATQHFSLSLSLSLSLFYFTATPRQRWSAAKGTLRGGAGRSRGRARSSAAGHPPCFRRPPPRWRPAPSPQWPCCTSPPPRGSGSESRTGCCCSA